MITFKQFLHEEDEEDTMHDSVEDAAREYIKHCTQFPDIENPLYRLSGDSWMGPINHPLRTRVPRTRKTESRGGSVEAQRLIFSQPAWKDYPPRRQSIFCSTTQEFVVDSVDDDGANLLMIYPFDGVKIAILDHEDLNTMNALKGTSLEKRHTEMSDLISLIHDAYKIFYHTDHYDDDYDTYEERLGIIKKTFNNNGKFNSEANGDDEMADKLAEYERNSVYKTLIETLKFVATELPERITPRAWGAKLVTSGGLDLPGTTRECWFSGKYLSVPYRYHDEFKAAVKKLQSEK